MRSLKSLRVARLLRPLCGRPGSRGRRGSVPMIWRRRNRQRPTHSILRVTPVAQVTLANIAAPLNFQWQTSAFHQHLVQATHVQQALFRVAPVHSVGRRAPIDRLLLLIEKVGRSGVEKSDDNRPSAAARQMHSRVERVMRPAPAVRDLADLLAARKPRRTAMLPRTSAMSSMLREEQPRPMALRHRRSTPQLFAAPRPRRSNGQEIQAAGARERPGSALTWRGPTTGKIPSGIPGARRARSSTAPALVWRNAEPARQSAELATTVQGPSPVAPSPAVVADAPAAPVRPAGAAVPAPDMARLVDEVVRRLERIGRDERMRRGL